MRKRLLSLVVICILCAALINAQESPQKKSGPLTDESRLALNRFVSAELVKVQKGKTLPCDHKKFLEIKVEEQPEKTETKTGIHMVSVTGCRIESGSLLQITSLDFSKINKGKIIVDLNGGTNQKESIMKKIAEHTQVGVGGAGGGQSVPLSQPKPVQTNSPNDPPGLEKNKAATIIVEFKGSVPDMTPDEFKKYLLPLVSFPEKRSAAVQWIDSIDVDPTHPKFKTAITENRVIVDMTSEMVEKALGSKPKVYPIQRETEIVNDVEVEVETWMYGVVPYSLLMVEFNRRTMKVICIKEAPDVTHCVESSKPHPVQ